MARTFDDYLVLVTGGGGGIGRETALAFVELGAFVIVADTSEAAGTETLSATSAIGGKSRFIACDVSDTASVDAMFDDIRATHGRLDCAFNNAGIDIEQPGEWGRIEHYDKVMAINARGVFLCMMREIEMMRTQGGGAIVNTSSVAGLGGIGPLAYTAAKHAVIGLTRSAAVTLAPDNIRINAVCPGPIDTAMIAGALEKRPDARAMISAMSPFNRIGTAREVADAVCWLCSPAASFITGHSLPIDGGFMAA